MKLSALLLALGIGLLTTGQGGPGLLCLVWSLVRFIVVLGPTRKPVAPQRVLVAAQEQAPMDWKLALSDVRTHVKDTGCLAHRSDFMSKDGFCPNGGSYWEHD